MNGDQPRTPDPSPAPWYLTRGGVWLGILVAGPLALPLVWMSPRFSRTAKWLLTIGLVAATYLMAQAAAALVERVQSRMDEIRSLLASA